MSESAKGEGSGILVREAAPSERETHAADWRENKWLAVGELLVVVLIFVADARRLIPFSKTPLLLLLGWISLWARKVGWRRVGLTRYRTWKTTLAMGIGTGVLLEAFELFVSQPLLVKWLGKQPDLELFRALRGNLKLTMLYLGLTWPVAAFGEEMVYRGYLMNRVADLLNRTRAAWVVSLIVVHVGFGLAHAYQGLTGVIDEGLMGLLLGLIYLATGRNLAVPVVAHGIQDSIDFALMFFGKYPGM
jgi:hypothetical protein